MEIIGIVLFALGILISVALHEAGHMWTAKAFGMKVTRFFIGFGPTLWSFRRKETEYGVKADPARRLRQDRRHDAAGRRRRARRRAPGHVALPGVEAHDRDVGRLGRPLRARHRDPVGAVRLRAAARLGQASTRPAGGRRPVLDCVAAELGGRPGRPGSRRSARRAPTRAARPCRRPAPGRPDHRGRRHPGRRPGPARPRPSGPPAAQTITLTYVRDGATVTTAPVDDPGRRAPKQDVDPNTPVDRDHPGRSSSGSASSASPRWCRRSRRGPVAAFGAGRGPDRAPCSRAPSPR